MIHQALRILPAILGLALAVVLVSFTLRIEPLQVLLSASPAFLGAVVAWVVLSTREKDSVESDYEVDTRMKWLVALAALDLVIGLALLAMGMLIPSVVLLCGGLVLVVAMRAGAPT